MDSPLEWRTYDPVLMERAALEFQCGDAMHDKELKRWLLESAPKDMSGADGHRTRIWVPHDSDATDRIIAFGALSRATWPFKSSTDGFPTLALIEALAVHRDFRRGGVLRRADGPRYGRRLLEELLLPEAEAMDVDDRRVGLFVRPQNTPAIALYMKFGFTHVGPDHLDETGVLHFYSKPLRPLQPGPA